MSLLLAYFALPLLGVQAGPAEKSFSVELKNLNYLLPFLELSMDHPERIAWRREEEFVVSAPGSAGLHYSGVLVGRGGSDDGTIVLVTFFDLASSREFRDIGKDPQGFARMAAETQSRSPYLGIVGPAEGISGPRSVKGRGFVGAEVSFRAVSAKTGASYTGSALELLFMPLRVEMRVQMAGRDPALLRRVRDGLLGARLGPSPGAAGAEQTGPMFFCRSDPDCWCRVFTGAGFIPGKDQSRCDLSRNRCEPCHYE